jgi:hypothetical protein
MVQHATQIDARPAAQLLAGGGAGRAASHQWQPAHAKRPAYFFSDNFLKLYYIIKIII